MPSDDATHIHGFVKAVSGLFAHGSGIRKGIARLYKVNILNKVSDFPMLTYCMDIQGNV